MNIFLKFCFVTIFTTVGITSVSAQESEQVEEDNQVLQVSTIIREPFVIQDGPELAGFSIDLWNKIAVRNGWQTEFILQDRFVQLLNSVKEPIESDAAIANISITSDREQIMDFSSAIFDGGLQVMVPNSTAHLGISSALFTRNIGVLAVLLLFVFIILGYLMSRFAVAGSWPQSLQNSYWNLFTLGQYGDSMPQKNTTRGIFVLWIMAAIVFVIVTTAEVTSTLITNKTGSGITTYLDLQNKTVGVSAGSTSENFMRTNNISTVSYDSLDAMFADVAAGNIDAVVHDAPVVQHYATYNGRGQVITVGDVFNKEQYGIALPENSLLREPINKTLLQLHEDGTYDDLYNKWFNE